MAKVGRTLPSLMKTIQKVEQSEQSVIQMMNKALSDRRLQSLLAKKAQIYSPETMHQEDCLWITGAGVYTAYRQMFVALAQIDESVRVSVTITDDDIGKTNYLIWAYGDSEDKASVTQMLIFLIEDILGGNGQDVMVSVE